MGEDAIEGSELVDGRPSLEGADIFLKLAAL